MRETCMSGSMSGSGKRNLERTEAPAHGESRRLQRLPVPYVTAPTLDSTLNPIAAAFREGCFRA